MDHTYESWAELHITVDKYGGSRYVGDSNCHLPKISLPHTGCGKTRQAGDRGGDNCLWTEFAIWLQPCTRGFSTANANIRVERDFSHFTTQSAVEFSPIHCPNGRLGQDMGFGGFAFARIAEHKFGNRYVKVRANILFP